MPNITTPTYAEVVKEVIGAVSAVQDAHGTMAASANDLLTAKEKFPVLEEAVAGKQGTLSMDTTKVGGIWSTCSYQFATKTTLPAGGTWIILYCTSWVSGSDRAAGTSIAIRPGGLKLSAGMYAWWNMCIRIS